jgi:hypothetical protein
MTAEAGAVEFVSGRECGTCSMCCKLPAIDYLVPAKPAGRWCQHCKPGQGCAIWPERPQGCITFNCDWRKNGKLGDEWRPDRAGFLLCRSSETSPYEIIVDPGRPDAWRKAPYYAALRRAARITAEQGLPIVVLAGIQRWLLLPDEEIAIPPEHFTSGVRLRRDDTGPEARWRVEFILAARAS